MPHALLDNLCGSGKSLKAQTPDADEIAGLLRTGGALARCGQYNTVLIAAAQSVADALGKLG
jgi:hypothetical protein